MTTPSISRQSSAARPPRGSLRPHGTLYLWRNHAAWFSDGGSELQQRHFHLKVLVALRGEIRLATRAGTYAGSSVILEPDCPHRYGADGLVFGLLLDPRLDAARRIRRRWLGEGCTAAIPTSVLETHVPMLTRWACQPVAKDRAGRLVQQMMASLVGCQAPSEPLDPRIVEAFRYAHGHLEGKLLLGDLAHRVRLSPGRFAHLFKAQAGLPVRRFLVWARLRRANRLILEGASLTEAAHAAGFADSAHFSRAYRQLFGVSPSALLRSRHVRVVVCVD